MKVGDLIEGTYVDRQEVPNTLKDDATQIRYTLIKEDGSQTDVYGRQGNPAVLSGLEVRKLGDKVGVRFDKELEPAKAGFNKTKVINVYWAGGRNEEALRSFQNPGVVIPLPVEEDEDSPFEG